MQRRATVHFWGSTVAASLFLGSVWSLFGRIGQPGFGPVDVILLTIAGLGFCAAFFVAARIAYVVGRAKKACRTRLRTGG